MPVRNSKSYTCAWTAHDLALQALTKFAGQINLGNGAKLSRQDAQTLCQLQETYDRTAERIRILRGKPLPGTVRQRPPKAPGKKSNLERKAAEPVTISTKPTPTPTPAVVPPQNADADNPSHPDSNELSDYPG